MSNEINIKAAEENFNLICSNLDSHNCKYNKEPEKLTVSLSVTAKDTSVPLSLFVDANHELITLYSFMNFEVPEDKRLETAVAISKLNYMLTFGNFNFDIETGKIHFIINVSYRDSKLGSEIITKMISTALTVMSDFTEKFLMLSKGYLSIDKFFEN